MARDDPLHELLRAQTDGSCIVVMNRTKLPSGPSFYALATQGLPRLLQLQADDLSDNEPVVGPMDVAAVKLGTELAQIPNLELIERQVLSLAIGR